MVTLGRDNNANGMSLTLLPQSGGTGHTLSNTHSGATYSHSTLVQYHGLAPLIHNNSEEGKKSQD